MTRKSTSARWTRRIGYCLSAGYKDAPEANPEALSGGRGVVLPFSTYAYPFSMAITKLMGEMIDPVALRVPVLFCASNLHCRFGHFSGDRSLLRSFVKSRFCTHLGSIVRSCFRHNCHVRTHPVLLPAQVRHPRAPPISEDSLHKARHFLFVLANGKFDIL